MGVRRNRRRRKPLHMTDARADCGGIPGKPGKWQIEDAWSPGDWETRGPGARAKFRFTATDPYFYCQAQKKWGPKVLRSSKAIMCRPFWYFVAETEWQGPISRGCFGSAKVPPESSLFRRLPPGTFGVFSSHRTRRVPRPTVPGGRGGREIGRSGKGQRGER